MGDMGNPRILLVISAQPTPKVLAEVAVGKQPPRDYTALQQELDAEVIHPFDAQTTRSGRLIKRLFGPFAALTWAAFCRRHKYDIIYTDTEIVGLTLALLLKLSLARPGHPRHVTLSHVLSPLKKRIFFRFGIRSHIDTMIVHCESMRQLATKKLHLPDERVVKLPYFVDVHFWQPLAPAPETVDDNVPDPVSKEEKRPMICAAGLEYRDYPTFLGAVNGLKVNVQIAAASAAIFNSPRSRNTGAFPEVPSNVSVGSYDYTGMRRLYSQARFVVVPLIQIAGPGGISVILEAMAMGKAVIVTGTRGQTDVVRDPRNEGRGLVDREWWPGFLDAPDIAETLGCLPTGFYVSPYDADDMRSTILYLLDHPEIAEDLGRNGRKVVEACFSREAFTKRFSATILGEPQLSGILEPIS
ncbi:MAG TPA: glycosyltransferase family 4 protein [Ktedonobacteraceae bacterium]|nr:glycosyltransferase family 4 protein [Ktedonobacteraceae bacterium]